MQTQVLSLKAPLQGFALPIEDVPDPVFAEKMVGDGLSIDPTSNQLLAPCNGEIILVHASRHAVTLRTPEGIEILMHIGLDTVMLKGEGFTSLVNEGDKVTTGQPLIEFEADKVALSARSLMTEIVITNGEQLDKMVPKTGTVVDHDSTVLELHLKASANAQAQAPEDLPTLTSETIAIPNPTGLHARPSATLANLAKRFDSSIQITLDGRNANAKSVVALMGLNVQFGDQVQLQVTGQDAQQALDTLIPEIASGLGEEGVTAIEAGAESAAPPSRVKEEEPSLLAKPSTDDSILKGVAASPGHAFGNLFRLVEETFEYSETAADINAELSRFDAALVQASVQLGDLEMRLVQEGQQEKAKIFAAHGELLSDPELTDNARQAIQTGKSAEAGWCASINAQCDILSKLNNEVLAGRVSDLRDLEKRLLHLLLNQPEAEQDLPKDTILVAEDLTPSDTASLDRSKVVGFVTTLGGSSSHAAILARSMGLPAIAGMDTRVLEQDNMTRAILDGNKGTLKLAPTEQEIATLREKIIIQQAKQAEDLKNAHQPAVTRDGHAVEVVGNIGGLKDAQQTVELGGEGVGLLRSEFLYLDRVNEPTEDEQEAIYSDILKALGPDRPMIVRTLDIGGDKPLAYLPMPEEENPFLGERGIRIGLNKPSILRTQVRAILKAAKHGKIRIMFPMIATVQELRLAKQVVEEERLKLNAPEVEVGIMVEVPSTAVIAEQFAKEADFFSIGTNDLTQYTLAMDRGHPKMAPFVDGLNPAVLGLIGMTVKAAHKHGKWVGVCGGLASDPVAVPLLLGLGVDELSCSTPALPEIKAKVRSLSLAQCQQLAEEALSLDSAQQVRELGASVAS